MKKLVLACYLLAIFTTAVGQASQNLRKIISLDKESVALNGGIRSDFGGKSRVVIPIDVPPNTIEWYYTFSTTRTTNSGIELRLVEQLTKLVDPSGMTALVASALFTPTGSSACDVYLMDASNANAFLAKLDQKGGSYQSIQSAERLNIRNGVVQIKDVKAGRWFLALRNPSASEGIVINIEVAAIVEEKDASAQQKSSLYGTMGWDAYKDGDIERCIDFSKKALALDNTLGWVKLNLGLCYLLKGEQETAANYYVDAIADIKRLPNTFAIQKHLQAGIDDIADALRKTASIKGSDYIQDLLRQELRKYQPAP